MLFLHFPINRGISQVFENGLHLEKNIDWITVRCRDTETTQDGHGLGKWKWKMETDKIRNRPKKETEWSPNGHRMDTLSQQNSVSYLSYMN